MRAKPGGKGTDDTSHLSLTRDPILGWQPRQLNTSLSLI
jgi:hypothetical protein